MEYCGHAQSISCSILCDPMDHSPSGSSVHGIFQARYWSGLPFPTPSSLAFLVHFDKLKILKKKKKLFMAVLGLRCSAGFSLVVLIRGYSLVSMCGLLIAVASLVAEHEL